MVFLRVEFSDQSLPAAACWGVLLCGACCPACYVLAETHPARVPDWTEIVPVRLYEVPCMMIRPHGAARLGVEHARPSAPLVSNSNLVCIR